MMKLTRRLSLFLFALALAAPVRAQLILTPDDSISAGVAGAPQPVSPGFNGGFGGQIGMGAGIGPVLFAWDSDVLGAVTLDVLGGVCTGQGAGSYDVAVIYLDAEVGGFADTSMFTDVAFPEPAAVSAGGFGGTPTPNLAPLAFGPGFTPEYAIAFINPASVAPQAFLYELVRSGPHVLVATLTATQVGGAGVCGALRISDMDLAMIGLIPGASFDWMATLLNAFNGFRSDEFHGAAVPPGNIGTNPLALTQGDFNTFVSVGPVVINEVEADSVGTDTLEFIELFGPPNLRLDGAAIVTYNGSDDLSYPPAGFAAALDLDGHVTDANGFFLVGSAAVTPAPAIVLGLNSVQNGADAVALYLADGASFPNDTPISSVGLADALVYDTGDTDDPVLLAALTPGQPQIDERGGGDSGRDSNQRCPDGAGGPFVTTGFLQATPTPGAANLCMWCGDGAVNLPSEVCDEGAANGTAASCCDGSCNLVTLGTECNASTDVCDPAETCDGALATCPADIFEVDGTLCADADLCNGDETCTGGICTAGTALTCDDGDVCTAEACDAATGCSSTPIAGCCNVDGDCDDADVCNGAETCSATACQAGTALTCDDGDACTAEACDAATGCSSTPIAGCCNVDGDCDDADVCNGAETCSGAACQAGTALTCDDGDACTAEACDAITGCSSTPIAGCCNVDADCDDSDLCTADSCSGAGGTCSASPITDCCLLDTDCDDSNTCTTDTCNTGTNLCERAAVPGCCSVDADCDDSNACTTDTCDGTTGICGNAGVPGCCLSDGDCDDSNTCTTDTCNPGTSTCGSTTIAGCCLADAECDDADACTTDTCDPGTATCAYAAVPSCGGTDGGVVDGGGSDGGTDSGGEGTGCGCAASRPDLGGALAGFLLLPLLGLAFRRRR